MHGDDQPPPPPPAPIVIAPPQAPAQTAMESAMANVDASQAILDRGILPRYAQQMTDIQAAQAPQLSEINLQQQRTYGPQLIQAAIDNLKSADPTGFAIRKAQGDLVLGQLGPDQFGKLSSGEQRQAEQDIRAGQVSRGGGTALSDTLDEAIQKYNLGRGLQQQQLSNAGSFLAGTPPQANFGALNQAGQTAPVGTQNTQGFSQGLFPTTNALISNQAQNYGTYANFAGGMNNYNLNAAKYTQDYTTNPFQENMMFGLGVAQGVGKIGGSIMGGAMGGMCWVAEELFGVDSEKTHRVRAYCMRHLNNKSPLGDFCRWYQDTGKEMAVSIQRNKGLREKARSTWELLDRMALNEMRMLHG